MDSNFIFKVVEQFLGNRGDYEIEIKNESEKSEGYLGEIVLFSVRKKSENRKHFFMKTTKVNQRIRDMAELAYEREAQIYSELFPKLELFLKSKNIENFMNFVPRSFYVSVDKFRETIVLEDLKCSNFELFERSAVMDEAHINLTLETFGKYHGLNIAFRDQKSKEFAQITGGWKEIRKILATNFGALGYIKGDYPSVLNILRDKGRMDLVELYSNLENNIEDLILRRVDMDDFRCVIHGDSCITNVMFKYQDNSRKPIAACLFDFQQACVDTPILDISSFFYSMANATAYRNFENHLKVYYNSLSSTLRILGSDPDKIISFVGLKNKWKKHAFFGVATTLILIKIQLLEPDETPDFGKIAESGQNLQCAFPMKIRKGEVSLARISDAFIHYGDLILGEDS